MNEATRSRVLSSEQVRLSAKPVRVGGRGATELNRVAGEAAVSEVRDATGNITEIHIQCACGKITVVACDYE